MEATSISTVAGLIAAVFTGVSIVAALAATLTRRVVEPDKSEINRAEELAREASQQTDKLDSLPQDEVASPTLDGDKEVLKILARYAADLRSEASRIAKRVHAERPSPEHVRLAASHLGSIRHSASALADIGLSFGALLTGGAAAFVINLATGGHAIGNSGVWAIGFGAAGIVLFTISATTKWIKR